VPAACTAPAIPQRRMNSIEREFRAVARGWSGTPSPCSMRRQDWPRLPKSDASASPTGPPPTIRMGVSNAELDEAIRLEGVALPKLPHGFFHEPVRPGFPFDQLSPGCGVLADGFAENILRALPVACRVRARTKRGCGIFQ